MKTVTRCLRLAALLGVVVTTYVAGTAVATAGESGFPEASVIAPDVLEAVHEEGRASVIVQLAETVRPEGTLSGVMAVGAQRRAIAAAQRGLLRELAGTRHRVRRKFKTVPFLALEVGRDALDALARSGRVRSVEENRRMTPSLAESVLLVGASEAFAEGFDGSGWAVAVIDTGVDKYHPFLAGKVVAEACFSHSGDCPNGRRTQIGAGAAAPCATVGCLHGTHVAGIAAGAGSLGTPIDELPPLFGAGACRAACDGAFAACRELGRLKVARRCNREMFQRCRFHGPDMCRTDPIAQAVPASGGGVAKGAEVIAIQVFSIFHGRRDCRDAGELPCESAKDSDLVAALEHVYSLRNSLRIAAVNMSLGGGAYESQTECDNKETEHGVKQVIDHLRSVGIATVVAAGNDQRTDAIAGPACISSAVSVGATTKSDTVALYSNSAPFLALLAPGSRITSSIPAGLFGTLDGTSMAAPHVAGAWAILKQKDPSASVDEILEALRSTGRPVTDPRNGLTTPRIQIAAALAALGDNPGSGSSTGSGSGSGPGPDCPADAPIACASGGCCPLDHPFCGEDGNCRAEN